MIRPANEVFQPERGGVFHHLGELLGLLGRYGKARWQLARVEGKAALGELALAAGLVAGAALMAVVAYLFLCAAVVLGVSQAFGGGGAALAWSCAGMTLLQAGLAALAVWWALRKARQPKLKETWEELRKEQAWVQNLAKS